MSSLDNKSILKLEEMWHEQINTQVSTGKTVHCKT